MDPHPNWYMHADSKVEAQEARITNMHIKFESSEVSASAPLCHLGVCKGCTWAPAAINRSHRSDACQPFTHV
eukprot:4832424-Amphidinium_carterae.3